MNVEYVLGDQLGSASVMTDSTGNKVSEMRYTPWGEVRYAQVESGVSTTPAYTLPKHTFTGQYSYMDDPSTQGVDGFGLMFYNARFYDPQVGRFAQADTIVPGGVQGLDRYAYVGNNPVRYIDPTGHTPYEPPLPSWWAYANQGLSVLQTNYVPIWQDDPNITGVFINVIFGTDYWTGLGPNACGLVMGSYGGMSVQDLGKIAKDNNYGYDPFYGIQPSGLVKTLTKAYGSSRVHATNSNNPVTALSSMATELRFGNVVGVDILVSQDANGYWRPSTDGETVAHFAKVLGIDFENGTIILADSLNDENHANKDHTWTVPFDIFFTVWYNPEIQADLGPASGRETLGYWYVVIDAPVIAQAPYHAKIDWDESSSG
jgi:RHS repeat-associated protein